MTQDNDIAVALPGESVQLVGHEQLVDPASLASTLRRRWRIALLVTAGMAGVSVSTIWLVLVPKYEVNALVHIAPFVRPILFSDAQTDISRQYRAYVATESQTIVSPTVILTNLNMPEVRSLALVVSATTPEVDFAARLSVRHVQNTHTLRVSMVGQHPEDMAVFVNSLVDVYLSQRESKNRTWDEKILNSLRVAQTRLEAQLETKGVELRQLADVTGAGTAGVSEAAIHAWLFEVQRELTEMRQNVALAEATLEALDASDGTGAPLELISDGLTALYERDTGWRDTWQRIVSLESAALDDERFGRGPENPEVFGRLDRIEKRRAALKERESEIRSRYESSVRRQLEKEIGEEEFREQVLLSTIAELEQKQSQVARQAFGIENLRHERERLEKGLAQVRQKIWNVEVEQMRMARVTMDSPAVAPEAPNIDKRLKYTAVACLLSLLLGAGTALLRDRLDTRVRDPKEIARQLGIPLLGILPYIRNANTTGPLRDDRVLEPMRSIATTLLASSRTGQTCSRLITGPNPGSGKSSLALNLARSLASTGRRVLLVDADNRRQGITKTCAVTDRPGLMELLEGTRRPDEAVYTLDSGNLNILPAGQGDERFGEILSRRNTQSTLSTLFEAYDEVIVDSSPVLAGSDAILLATLVDEVILVLRAGQSTREEAQTAHDYLATVGGKPVGVILNAVDPRSSPYHAYDRYTYAPAGDRTET
ncbi:MAG: polysaccharide biosynthesis tyrosine autokinase [Planctomycetes bacterium]|nr:polysaccharide biosynthesis tyrosine autokinase [Planctomycetota bacterium]